MKLAVVSSIALAGLVAANAAPEAAVTNAPAARDLEDRQNIDELISNAGSIVQSIGNAITDGGASLATDAIPSLFSQGTDGAASIATDAIPSLFSEGTEGGKSVADKATSAIGDAASKVTSAGGNAGEKITSGAGAAGEKVTSGAGAATSAVGSAAGSSASSLLSNGMVGTTAAGIAGLAVGVVALVL